MALVDVDVEIDVALDDADDSREDTVVDVDDANDKDVDGDWFEPSPNPGNNAREEIGSRAKLVLLVVDDLYEVEDCCA